MDLLLQAVAFLWELKIAFLLVGLGMLFFVVIGSFTLSLILLTIRLCFVIVNVTRNYLWYPMRQSFGNTTIWWERKTKVLTQKPLLLRQWEDNPGRYFGS